MTKAILLDMGGVLLNLDLPGCLEKFRTECGFEDVESYFHTTHHKGFVADLEAGLIGPEDFFAECRSHCRPGTTDIQIRNAFCSLVVGMDASTAEYLKELRERYPLFMLSNNNCIMMPHNSALFDAAGLPMKDTFRDLFLSYEFKCTKPERRFYLEAVRRTGFKAEELLFVDDSQKNVDAAIECGIHAVFYPVGTPLRNVVESALI